MATSVLSPPRPGSATHEAAGAVRYLARQPILDRRGKVHGYELLFRSGPEAFFRGDGDLATRTMIDNTLMFGLELLTGGFPAFVNCTSETLIKEQAGLLPPSMTVVEVLETVDPLPALIAACSRLKSLGFRLALDDFVWTRPLEPLIEMADYVKIDFLASGERERGQMLKRLRGAPIALVAEKVETEEDYEQACAEGFTLFQGYYFCRPTLLARRRVPSNKALHLELLRELQESPLNLHRVSGLVKRDAGLTYRLLRMVNSPVCAVRQEVRSIRGALISVGEDAFRRIATLAIASELNAGQPAEIVRMAYVRARFCELASASCGLNALEQYLLGMLSMLPAMLRTTMREAISVLPLRGEISDALLGKPNRERNLLAWLEANEAGDWPGCDAIARRQNVDHDAWCRCFSEALVWAELTLPGAQGNL